MATAPEFTLPDQNGAVHSLSEYRGGLVLLYFYPKDSTPGCTVEACSFRDNFSVLQALGVTVLGVSGGTVRSHKKFADAHQLPFTLLVDKDFTVATDYGVYGDKKMFGKTFVGIHRDSFLIDEKGEIVHHFESVKPEEHVEDVVAFVKQYQSTHEVG